ncbi:hypothetical protein [Streptomyces sp. NPDC048001]|uniref:hypothetical protein n=1 Tax=Streptomyces sp. NPDC048001 TaxID=3365498 RepID=UPI003720F88B
MFDIRLNVDSLGIDSSDPTFVTGEVWITLNGESFPGGRWADSPISVLGSLGSAIEMARAGEAADAYFFEGPYFVKFSPAVSSGEAMQVRATALRDYWDESAGECLGQIILDEVVSLGDIEAAYRSALERLISWGERGGEAKLLSILQRLKCQSG